MTTSNSSQTNGREPNGDESPKMADGGASGGGHGGLRSPRSAQRPTLSRRNLTKRYFRLLIFGLCLWLGYQVEYLSWDLKAGALSPAVAGLHFLNFLIVIVTGSLLVTSMGRRYWRWILWSAGIAMLGSTLVLGLMSGTPLPLLTTFMLVGLVPAAFTPWRFYWNASLGLTGCAAMLVMETFLPISHRWNEYWLVVLIGLSLVVASDVVRDLRRTRQGLTRVRRIERQLIETRRELQARVGLLEASESKLRAEIAERERAERLARSNESFLRAVFEASPDPMVINSLPDGKVVAFNAQYGALAGLKRGEGVGRTVIDLNVVADVQQLREYVERLMSDGAVTNMPMELRDESGATHPYLISAALADMNGQACAITIARDISGVREAEDLLQQVAEASPDPIVVTAYPEGRMIYCNRKYEELVGRPQDQLVGRFVSELHLWANSDEERQYDHLLRVQDQIHNFQANLISSDGKVRPCLLAGIKFEINGHLCVLTVSRDIGDIKQTERELIAAREELRAKVGALQASDDRLQQEAHEREAVEKRLRRSEAWLRKLFDTSLDIIGINSLTDGRYISMNRALQELTGQSAEQMLGRTALDLDLWEDPKQAWEYYRLLKRDGSVRGFEANLKRWDGTVINYSASAVVTDIEDEPCIVAIVHDITHRKRAERELSEAREELSRQVEALLESERRVQQSETVLRKIFEASPDPTALIRVSDGKHLAVNQACTRVFGYTREELSRLSVLELNLWVNDEDRQEYLKRLHQDGRVRNMEALVRAKDGHQLVGQLSAERVEIGGVKCVVALIADITGHKRVEAELVAAREDALSASEAKSNFLSSMSHEIRTPMNAMLGMADLLWETSLTGEQRRFLDTIRSNSNALLDLINGILDLAKVESGRLSLEWIPFDLRELVERVLETLGVRAHQKWLELAGRIAPAVPLQLVGDPMRLRQILMNLIGNAIKFTERGEIVLEIETSAGETGQGKGMGLEEDGRRLPRQPKLTFVVRDTGIGIEADRIDEIFASFTQAESSIARKYGGSGLGLAIVKRLVELMGGTLTVESEPGKGSAFSFAVPFQVQSNAEAAGSIHGQRSGPAEATKVATGIRLPDLNGRRILVADDTAINRTVVREMLEARGARVLEAASGEQALAMVTEALEGGDPFEIVLLDGRMPGVDGIETARRLVRDDEMRFRGGAVILMVTSDALNPTLTRCREVGLAQIAAFRYVVKPLRMADLAEVLSQIIEMGQGPNAKAPPIAQSGQPRPIETSGAGVANFGTAMVAAGPKASGRPLTILLAEDSPDNRMLIEAYFKATGYQLDTVGNGELAVEQFKRKRYDLVLMDIHMPVMDGYTAVRLIRQWEKAHGGGHTPVMALTASAQDEAVRESFAAGCDNHMAKPIKRGTLLQAIEEMTSDSFVVDGADDDVSPATAATGGERVARNVVQIEADLSDLVPAFLAHKRDDARAMIAAIDSGDYATLSQLGHKMKGEGGSYGFDAITLMGAAIEEAALVKDAASARRWATELTAFLDTVEIVYA